MLKRVPRIGTFLFCLFICLFSQPVLAAFDTDGDLLPDEWEIEHGFNPSICDNESRLCQPCQPGAEDPCDPDQDYLSNLDEFFAGTDPRVYSSAGDLSQTQLLRLFQGKSFLFFWEQSESAQNFLTHDYADYNNIWSGSQNHNSIAAIGFSFIAYVVGDQNNWIDHQEAYERIEQALERLTELQQNQYDVVLSDGGPQGNRHGYLYHFINNDGFRSQSCNPDPNVCSVGTEISTIDHALLTAGALIAASYYKGTRVEALAHQLYDNTEWSWLYNIYDPNVIHQAWLERCDLSDFCNNQRGISDIPDVWHAGQPRDGWNRYSELMILLFQAMAKPEGQGGVPAYAWQFLDRGTDVMFPYEWVNIHPGSEPENFAFVANMPDVALQRPSSTTDFQFIHAGSIHNHQYSHMFVDFRKRPEMLHGTDFFNNSISATMANRQFSVTLGTDSRTLGEYQDYGENSWGLGAGITSAGYKVQQPILQFETYEDTFSEKMWKISDNTDNGSVYLFAPLGSASFTPLQAIAFAKNYLQRYQIRDGSFDDVLIGRYGFMNSYNSGTVHHRSFPPTGHYATTTIGIDLGAIIGGIENHLTGLIWKLGMGQNRITAGLSDAHFDVHAVEPIVMNFDGSVFGPTDPAWSGIGGQDRNSFGGLKHGFGTGTIGYENIGDPRPDIDYGPQNFAIKIMTSNDADDGAFIELNNHSVSQAGRIGFWIKGNAGNEQFLIGLKDSPSDYMGQWGLNETEKKILINDYLEGGQITTNWQEVRIPLSVFSEAGVRLTRLHNVSFTNVTPGGGTIWVDDISFFEDTTKPEPPVNVRVDVENDQVLIAWNGNAERDVVGYRVYRKEGGGGFVKISGDYLVVADRFIDPDPDAIYSSFEYAVSAVDQDLNESEFSNQLFWTVHHIMPAITSNVYSSAGAAQMILSYLNHDVSQEDIYTYGIQYNKPENPAGSELDPQGMDSVLGHFDPYDLAVASPYNQFDSLTDGNPYQGYNYFVESKLDIHDFMRDLAHWMDYPVPVYWGSTERTNPEKVPPAVPIFGNYNNWVVVNGFSASDDPLPNEQNPWYTPDFTVYGFWLTDPSPIGGIGVNRFITAEQAADTYFRPLQTSDVYSGKYVMVAEPPPIRSSAHLTISGVDNAMEPDKSLQFMSALNYYNSKATSEGYGDADITLSPSKILSLDWQVAVPYYVRNDTSFENAFLDTTPKQVFTVDRLDGDDYHIVTFAKRVSPWSQNRLRYIQLISAAIILDQNGRFIEATWVDEPEPYPMLTKVEVLWLILNHIYRQTRYINSYYWSRLWYSFQMLRPRLVWKAGLSFTSSPFEPYWKVQVGRRDYCVTQNRKVFDCPSI